MCMINDVTKSWMKLEASALEKYKYTNEGPCRTPGSYMLTNMKSIITLADEDPKMFTVSGMVRIAPVVTAFAIGSIGTLVVVKIKEHVKSKSEKSVEDAAKNLVEEKEND